eukprot:446055-Rhodomonas_salina.1
MSGEMALPGYWVPECGTSSESSRVYPGMHTSRTPGAVLALIWGAIVTTQWSVSRHGTVVSGPFRNSVSPRKTFPATLGYKCKIPHGENVACNHCCRCADN